MRLQRFLWFTAGDRAMLASDSPLLIEFLSVSEEAYR